jgi:hypothetical protein
LKKGVHIVAISLGLRANAQETQSHCDRPMNRQLHPVGSAAVRADRVTGDEIRIFRAQE